MNSTRGGDAGADLGTAVDVKQQRFVCNLAMNTWLLNSVVEMAATILTGAGPIKHRERTWEAAHDGTYVTPIAPLLPSFVFLHL
jgi:hypothetical protein